MHFGTDAVLSRDVREMDVREPFPRDSVVDGVCRKIRACVGVTSAMERLGESRMRARMDIVGGGGRDVELDL